MRMTVKPFDVLLDDETRPVVFLQTVFDEGVTLMGGLLVETNELMHEIYAAIVRCLHRDGTAKSGTVRPQNRQRRGENCEEPSCVICIR